MPRVLGIDTSLTATGLARIDVGPSIREGVEFSISTATVSAPPPRKNDKSKTAMARRVMALRSEIESAIVDADDIANGFKPDLIAVESLAYGAKGASAWVLPWVFGCVCELAVVYGIPLIEVTPNQRAKYVAGAGNADKDTVMLAAVKRWPEADIRNNNEADAAGVGAVGCHFLNLPIVHVSKYHEEVMAAIRKTQAL